MGRGRAKAKQTKVARELKYSSPVTDLEALQRELSSGTESGRAVGNGDGDHGGQDHADEAYTDEDDEYRR